MFIIKLIILSYIEFLEANYSNIGFFTLPHYLQKTLWKKNHLILYDKFLVTFIVLIIIVVCIVFCTCFQFNYPILSIFI